MQLTVDLREQKKWIEGFRSFVPARFPEWEVDVRLIEVGDYAVEDKLGIEHKAPGDFLSSLQSGRLFQQAEELASAYERAFIFVDGLPRNLFQHPFVQMTEDNVFGACASLAMRRGTPVIFTGKNPNHFMLKVMKFALKTQGDGSFVYNPIRRQGSKKEKGRHLIAGLPGVGPKRARLILEQYGTPLRAIQNYEEWQHDIKGIGKATVESVAEVLEPSAD